MKIESASKSNVFFVDTENDSCIRLSKNLWLVSTGVSYEYVANDDILEISFQEWLATDLNITYLYPVSRMKGSCMTGDLYDSWIREDAKYCVFRDSKGEFFIDNLDNRDIILSDKKYNNIEEAVIKMLEL